MSSDSNLFDQYKLYVELMDRVSQRRENTNKFYITLLAALFTINASNTGWVNHPILPSVLGIIFCVIWLIHIRSFRLLNQSKFKVIHEMEQQLPYPCFDREWQFIQAQERKSSYVLLSQIEQMIPVFMGLLFITFLVFKFYK